jgi:hypothetical protein
VQCHSEIWKLVIRNFSVNTCTTKIRVWHKLSQRTLSPQISKFKIQKQWLVFERNKTSITVSTAH